jgi:hypothetical protein
MCRTQAFARASGEIDICVPGIGKRTHQREFTGPNSALPFVVCRKLGSNVHLARNDEAASPGRPQVRATLKTLPIDEPTTPGACCAPEKWAAFDGSDIWNGACH